MYILKESFKKWSRNEVSHISYIAAKVYNIGYVCDLIIEYFW